MRSVSVAIGVTALAAATLSGCTSSPDYNAVCIDEDTRERVSDYQCDDDEYSSYSGGYSWYYIGGGQRVPSIGSRVSGGSTSRPSGSVNGGPRSSSGGYSDSGGSSHDYGGFGGRSGGVSS
jgi:hypothetical protein